MASTEAADWAYTLGWRLFVALVALTPIVISALPVQIEAGFYVRGYDPTNLPKLVTILVLAGFSLALAMVSAVRGRRQLRWHPTLWILVALVGWAGIASVFSASISLSVWGASLRNDGLTALIGYALVALLAVQYVGSERQLRVVAIAATVGGVVVSAYALMQYAGIEPIDWGQTYRVIATFGNADMLGDYLLFPLALGAGLALSATDRRRALWPWVAVGVCGAALIATQTRGAWIGALAGVLVFAALMVPRGDSASRAKRLSAAVVGAVVLVAASVAAVISRANLSASPGSASLLWRLSNGRSAIWGIGLRAWLQRPIVGWGPDDFRRAFASVASADWYHQVGPFFVVDNAHNFLIQRLVTLGLPGLLLTVWAIAQAFADGLPALPARGTRERALAVAPVAALVALVVGLLTGVSVPVVSVWLWLSVGLLVSASARPVAWPPAASALVAGAGVALAIWASSWMAADLVAGWAMRAGAGATRYPALEQAVAIDPLAVKYRALAGDALYQQAQAQAQAGAPAATIDATLLSAIRVYRETAASDRGDAAVRFALTNALLDYGSAHPGGDVAQQALSVAQEAVALAPNSPVGLVLLAQAYDATGQHALATSTAARVWATDSTFAAQKLGSLGKPTP